MLKQSAVAALETLKRQSISLVLDVAQKHCEMNINVD